MQLGDRDLLWPEEQERALQVRGHWVVVVSASQTHCHHDYCVMANTVAQILESFGAGSSRTDTVPGVPGVCYAGCTVLLREGIARSISGADSGTSKRSSYEMEGGEGRSVNTDGVGSDRGCGGGVRGKGASDACNSDFAAAPQASSADGEWVRTHVAEQDSPTLPPKV